jgi:hypothetical protein
MPQTVTRTYDASKPATAAVNALKKQGFAGASLIAGLKPAADGAEPALDGVIAAIVATGVPAAAAKTLAEAVGKGASLVAVRPAFGTAGQAAEILDSFGPTSAATYVVTDEKASAKTSSTPLSTAFGWALLSKRQTPLSTDAKWALLTDRKTPLSTDANWKLLSDNPTPLSNKFNWPLLSNNKTPCSSWLNQPLLSNDATPLSTKFNWPLLKAPSAPEKAA